MADRITPGWMRKGVRTVLNHEPICFMRRRGGWFVDDVAVGEISHSEETVKKLAAAGVDVYIVHGYKGFGLEFEKREHGRLRRLREHCTKHGVRLGTYCQVATIVLETMQSDYPDAPNWIQKDAHGHPNFYNTQTYRNFPCFHNDDFKAYYKTVIKYLVEEIGTDLLHFDNLIDQREPYACRCDRCAAAFTEHLVSKYTDSALAERRFGHARLRFIKPPVWHPDDHPYMADLVVNPVVQEWEEFRCLTIKGFIEEMSDYVTSLNPEVGVEANCGSIPESNRYRSSATYWPHLAPHVDLIYNESEGRMPRVNPNGTLGANVVGYKMGRTLGVGIWGGGNFETETDLEKTIGERLAFSPDYSFALGVFDRYQRVYERYNAFYRENQAFYHGREQVRDVMVLDSVYTHRTDSLRSRYSVLLAVQTMLQSGIPFAIGFDDALANLDGVKVLFLADQECLSDEQCRRICAYVRNGGGLVITGDTSRYDDWHRVRAAWGLAEMFGWKKECFGSVEPMARESVYIGIPRPGREGERREFGAGRAVYLPSILPEILPEASFKALRQECWTLPGNREEILGAISWACDGRLSARLHAGRYCCAEFMRDPLTGKRVFHIVNFDRTQPARNVRIETGESPPAELRARVPGHARELILTPVENDPASFEIPEVEHYCLVFEC